MSTQVIAKSSIPHWRHRASLLTVLAVVAAAGVVVGVVALTSSGTSDTHATTERSAPVSAAGPTSTCSGDGGSLLAVVGSMPADVYDRVVSRLSPQTRALLGGTALEIAVAADTGGAATAPAPPDASTLAGILARVGTNDARAIMSGLSPETRTAVSAASPGTASPQPVCG